MTLADERRKSFYRFRVLFALPHDDNLTRLHLGLEPRSCYK
jgi:hypothetical protein